MFHPSFVPVLVASIGIGVLLYQKALVDPPMGPYIDSLRESCTDYSPSNPLCVLEPFFKELVSNPLGKAVLTLFGTTGSVVSLHLYIRAGQPGRSWFASVPVFILNSLAGQLFGAGIVGPIILPMALVIARSLDRKPRRRGILPPPSYTYTVLLLAIQVAVFATSASLTAIPTDDPRWKYANYAFQGFPLLFVPLAFVPTPSYTVGSTVPTITATTFSVLKVMHVLSWYGTIGPLVYTYTLTPESTNLSKLYTLPVYFMVLDYAGFLLVAASVYLIDVGILDAPKEFAEVSGMLVRVLLTGPAAALAAYFEARERASIAVAQAEVQKKES